MFAALWKVETLQNWELFSLPVCHSHNLNNIVIPACPKTLSFPHAPKHCHSRMPQNIVIPTTSTTLSFPHAPKHCHSHNLNKTVIPVCPKILSFPHALSGNPLFLTIFRMPGYARHDKIGRFSKVLYWLSVACIA
jgi:hypothetical protein